jgi:hypothetical protein
MNNSNQAGIFLFMAIVIGVFVYVFMYFGTEMENQNLSASYGKLAPAKSVNLFSNNLPVVDASFAKEIRSDLSGITLPANKMKSTSGGNYAQGSNPEFLSTGIEQTNVQDMNQSSISSRTTTSSTANYAGVQSSSYAIGNASVQYISNQQNPTKSDISALLLLDTRAAETAMASQQSAKRATPALAAKTANFSTDLSANKKVQKVDGDPNEPGGSLPVGDGVWIMLSMLGVYCLLVAKYNFKLAKIIGLTW